MTTPASSQTILQEEILGWILGVAFVAVGILINYSCAVWLVGFLLFLTW
jgi:hypothetical protein